METVKEPVKREHFPLGERNGQSLSLLRRSGRNIGTVIAQPDSPKLIAGVEIETGTIHPDDRGFFSELFRVGASRLTQALVDCPTLQVSVASSYPGIIKALHYHFEQTDFWAPIEGMFQVVLCDLRDDSLTHGEVNTLYVGILRPWRIKIPPGVGHGYKIVGTDAATLVYLTDKFYNPQDEGRLAYNHPFLNYDWELQSK
ncbi:MAG TPA: dTDP-4-dehydrorhamnose 3,5-epimerase family protein [Terriglobia bacterium]|nr:dTDP-4-dehydrorhamnose 3,5-epimerase family protein [Terriglobia bacterium]